MKESSAIEELIETVHQLRAPGGCPWDREQTFQSLRPHLIEEAYEVLDVLDELKKVQDIKDKKLNSSLKEELGDLLLQILLHSEIAKEESAFDIHEVASNLNEKLIRRHPHVFGDQKVDSSEGAYSQWEKQKMKEKGDNPNASVLDGLPKQLPALQRVTRVIDKVTRVGFQWPDLDGPIDKINEELQEWLVEVRELEKNPQSQEQKAKVSDELGDLLFTIANVAYLMKLKPEDALRGTLSRFETRFRHVEKGIKSEGKNLEDVELSEMDRYWDQAKELEKNES